MQYKVLSSVTKKKKNAVYSAWYIVRTPYEVAIVITNMQIGESLKILICGVSISAFGQS